MVITIGSTSLHTLVYKDAITNGNSSVILPKPPKMDSPEFHMAEREQHRIATKQRLIALLKDALHSRVPIIDSEEDDKFMPLGVCYRFAIPDDVSDASVDRSDEFARHAEAIVKVACIGAPMSISRIYMYRPGNVYEFTVALKYT